MRLTFFLALCFLFAFEPLVLAQGTKTDPSRLDAGTIVKDAIEYWRDSSSYAEASMTVHRPDWERSMSFESWTKGNKHSLVRFTAPAKDAGSASLTVDNSMWSFAPKINKVIKIPPSMMAQSWMGSDFSYQDLSKADDILVNYTHKLQDSYLKDGHTVYVVAAYPREAAPVVWGKEVLHIRDDRIMLEHDFYDQDMQLIKKLTATDISEIGGKLYAKVVRMEKVGEEDEWTQVKHTKAEFGLDVPDRVFTLSNLRNPRN